MTRPLILVTGFNLAPNKWSLWSSLSHTDERKMMSCSMQHQLTSMTQMCIRVTRMIVVVPSSKSDWVRIDGGHRHDCPSLQLTRPFLPRSVLIITSVATKKNFDAPKALAATRNGRESDFHRRINHDQDCVSCSQALVIASHSFRSPILVSRNFTHSQTLSLERSCFWKTIQQDAARTGTARISRGPSRNGSAHYCATSRHWPRLRAASTKQI
jgi:hypothetical protein